MNMNLPEKKQRWVYHAGVLPQPAGAGVTRRVLAYTDGPVSYTHLTLPTICSV